MICNIWVSKNENSSHLLIMSKSSRISRISTFFDIQIYYDIEYNFCDDITVKIIDAVVFTKIYLSFVQ